MSVLKTDRGDIAVDLPVFSIEMACAYYACVFDAVVEESAGDAREMRIGVRTYRLVADRTARGGDAPLHAPVEDVAVSIARVATKGGKILEPTAKGEDGGRFGEVRDPFGHRWIVTGA